MDFVEETKGKEATRIGDTCLFIRDFLSLFGVYVF